MNSKRVDVAFVVVLCIVCASAGPAMGQACDWLRGDGIPGVDNPVYAATTWDPDAAGPEPELLVVGGYFSLAGDVVANSIATWDGSRWSPLGSGINGGVRALAVYNGELIAGGSFTTAGGATCNRIAPWDGASWQPLGTGLTGGSSPDVVRALAALPNGDLVAGGAFTKAGAVACNRIARWDGEVWSSFGTGMSAHVFALATLPGDDVIAGGAFRTAGGQVSYFFAHWGCEVCPGDLNCDGVVSFDDINPFVLALSNWTEWRFTYTGCPERNADINGDGQYGGLNGFGDINPFVELLAGSGGYPIPCP
ncbi:MAG: hypothetical protein AB1601_15380 [Planctomycetota bacterium]